MKYESVPVAVRRRIETQLRKKGIPPAKINPRSLSVRKAGDKLRIKYKDVEFSMRSPSQKAVDSWWKTAGHTIVGGILVLGTILLWERSKKNSA